MSAKKFETGQAVFLARWTLDGFCSEPATIQSVGRKYAVVTTASGNVVRVCLVYSRDAMKKSVAAIGLTANEAIATGETWNTQSKKDSMNALVSDVQNMLERADEAIDFLDKMKIVIQGGGMAAADAIETVLALRDSSSALVKDAIDLRKGF